MKKIFILFIFSTFVLTSCQYFTLLSNREWKKNNDKEEVDVYLCGYENAAPCYAYYWKNGEQIMLSDSGITGNTTYATGIIVKHRSSLNP